MSLRTKIPPTFLFAAAVVAVACDPAPADQGAVGQFEANQPPDGILDRSRPFEVELRGQTRLVAIEELHGGTLGVTIQAADETLLCAAVGHDGSVVQLDIDPLRESVGEPCEADACELDAVTEDILDAAASGDLTTPEDREPSFRKGITAYQWCHSTCALAYNTLTEFAEQSACYGACYGVFCPIAGCW